MSTYCVSDLHGMYSKYKLLLETISFSDRDTLYIIGDMVDRGPQPITLVQDIMVRPNVIPLAGNHDVTACLWLGNLIDGGRAEELDDETMMDMLLWSANGGESTLTEFRKLTISQRIAVVEWLMDLDIYSEIRVGGKDYILVHTGLGANAEPGRELDSYDLEDYLFSRSDYSRIIYPDKFIVSGHTPTQTIPGNPNPGRIYRANNHIAIDCGCCFGWYIGALCLETWEEIYV